MASNSFAFPLIFIPRLGAPEGGPEERAHPARKPLRSVRIKGSKDDRPAVQPAMDGGLVLLLAC